LLASALLTLAPLPSGQSQEPEAPPLSTGALAADLELPAPDPGWPAAALVDHPQLAPVTVTRIEARYDETEKRIHGRLQLTWRNTATVAVPDLCFHHYLNAFSSNRTTFFEESGGQLRGDRFRGKQWGWIEVSSLTLPDGTDLKPRERFLSPDDGNPHDRTVAYYPLPQPVPPGGQVTVEARFESQLPKIFARTGANRNFVLAGQWFPKIGVFEDRGDRGRQEPGWNCHQFHANSEFYADFGHYDVTLRLPQRYQGKVGATGVSLTEQVEGDEVVARFVQQGVHDFAWTADPDYLVIRDRFDPATDVPAEQVERIARLLAVDAAELTLQPVDLTLYLQPAHANQAERYLSSVKAAIRGYGLRLGAYPWGTLTLVDPPTGAGGAGGMEYPTFITLGTSPLLSIPPFRRLRAPEQVTIHEFGHQFFQGMIANNEFEESWIDEGINSYYEMVVMEEEYRNYVEFLGLRLPAFDAHWVSVAAYDYLDPVATPAWRFANGGSYGVNSYRRTAVTLRHLENLLGPETFARAMRSFFTRYQFRHPSTADFEAAIQEATGQDLSWFFRQALHTARELDYAVRSVESERIDDDRGVFWEDGGRVERGEEDDGGLEITEEDDDGPFRTRVRVERRGPFVHPVEVELRFEDGSRLRRRWDGAARWARWTMTTPERLTAAVVDPDGVLALDTDRLNNSRRREERGLPAAKLLTDALFWVQSLFGAGGLLS
jgi:hypothetical protein